MIRFSLFPVIILILLAGSCLGQDYYYESVTYQIEPSSSRILYQCSMSMASLNSNLTQLEIGMPFKLSQLTSVPKVLVGKSVVEPQVITGEDNTTLLIGLPGMKVGDMNTVVIQFSTTQGVEPEPGSGVPIRTLDLGGEVTSQILSLDLPSSLTVDKVEVPNGTIKPGSSSGVQLPVGGEAAELVFVLRKKTMLDNRYFRWSLIVAAIAIPSGYIIHRRYR